MADAPALAAVPSPQFAGSGMDLRPSAEQLEAPSVDWFAQRADERRKETDAARGGLAGGVAAATALFGGSVSQMPAPPHADSSTTAAPPAATKDGPDAQLCYDDGDDDYF